MGLNDIIERQKKCNLFTLQLTRHQMNRIIEALRIATRARTNQYKEASRDCATATQLATIEQQIKDYNDLKERFRNDTARTI